MNSKKTKNCYNCDFCKIFYEKPFLRLWRRFDYYCVACDKVTDKNDFCEKWEMRKKRELDLSAQRFDQVENDVKFLYAALQENK